MGAQTINTSFDRENMILGMTEIINNEIDGVTYEGACAENIKCAIEKIVNEFNFDKSKIKGIFRATKILNFMLTNLFNLLKSDCM